MLFYTKTIDKKNVKLVNSEGKDICKFSDGILETENKKLISILKNKKKYPFIFWDEEVNEDNKENIN